VATVSINGGVNAAILAAQILAVDDAELSHKLVDHRTTMAEQVLDQNLALQQELNQH
jgi:5-(carboxyamino)imidazole ribonucleotide mutase